MHITWSSCFPINIRYAIQNPNYETNIQKSINALPFLPNIANPSSEYEPICSPSFNLQAIYNLIVYILRHPHNIMPMAPPKTPTWEIADGVAKIPIPIKHLNMLK